MARTEIRFVKASAKHAQSYGLAVAEVAKERKFLATTEGFPADSTNVFVENIVRNNLSQYYALDGDMVVGWCDLLPKSFEGMNHVGVLGMGVVRSYRGRGIGRELLLLAMTHAKEINHLEKAELEVFRSNTAAVRLYESEGFVFEGERIDSRKIDGRYDHIILMGRKL